MDTKPDCVIVGDIETNCWLYPFGLFPVGINPNGAESNEVRPCIVIDPGDEAELIVFRLLELRLVPVYIFLTHGHFDHLSALPDLMDALGKGVFENSPLPKIGIHREDSHYLKPMPGADILFEDGDSAGPFKVLHVPGHTPGSSAFYDEKAGVLFSGDTLFRGGWGRTDLPGGNEALLSKSLIKLLALQENTVVCPGHGPLTKIGAEAGLIDFRKKI